MIMRPKIYFNLFILKKFILFIYFMEILIVL